MADLVSERARELLAAEYDAAGRPLVAIDLRTGNVGRMGVNFVDREIAERAITKALSASDELREAAEPFLKAAEPILTDSRDFHSFEWTKRCLRLTVGDYRKLAGALHKGKDHGRS